MKKIFKYGCVFLVTCIWGFSLIGCNGKKDGVNIVEETNQDFLKETYDKFYDTQYDEAMQSYYKYIKDGGKATEFNELDALMIEITDKELKLDPKYKTVEELNKHSIAFGDLDNDEIPEIYQIEQIDKNSVSNRTGKLNVYKYDGSSFKDVSPEFQTDETSNSNSGENNVYWGYGYLTIGKVNSNKKGLFNSSSGGKCLGTTVNILDQKLKQVDCSISRTDELPRDINNDGIIETAEVKIDPESKNQSESGSNKILSWYQFDEDYKRVLVKQQFIIKDENNKWKTVDTKPGKNKPVQQSKDTSSNIKLDPSNSKGVCELSDEEIIDIFKTSYTFELDSLNKDIMKKPIDKQGVWVEYIDQSIGLEEKLNQYREYFSNKYVDNNIRTAFKVENNKVCVKTVQGEFNIDEYNSVVEKEYDNNVIKANISIISSGEKEIASLTLIKEYGKWKVDGGSRFVTS